MNPTLAARLTGHGILVLGDVDLPVEEAHTRLRAALGRHFPGSLRSYVFWLRGRPEELHYSDDEVAAVVSAAR